MGMSLPHLIIFAVIIAIGFVPSIIAFARNHTQKWFVMILNIVSGWTVIGWVAALVWAIVGKSASTEPDLSDTFS